MTITTGAGTGVQVNSAAKDSAGSATALGSQATARNNQIIMPEAVSANNEGNLMTSPVYGGRLIRLRHKATGVASFTIAAGGTGHAVDDIIPLSGGTAQRQARIRVTSLSGSAILTAELDSPEGGATILAVGEDVGEYSVEPGNPVSQGTSSGAGTGATFTVTWKDVEETRYVIDEPATNTLTLNEPWIDGPIGATNPHNYRVFYIIQDAATVNGLGLINKRNFDYTSTRFFRVTGAGTNGGLIAFLDNVSLETDNNNSTTQGAFDVESGGEFWNGYLHLGKPFGGGYMIHTTGAADLAFNVDSGGRVRLYDYFSTTVERNALVFNGDVKVDGMRNAGMSSSTHVWTATSSNPVSVKNAVFVPNDSTILREIDIELKGTDPNIDINGVFFQGGSFTEDLVDNTTETKTLWNVGWGVGGATFATQNNDGPRRQVRLTIGDDNAGANPKIWNMINPFWGTDGLTPNNPYKSEGINDLDLFGSNQINWSSGGSDPDLSRMNEIYSVDLTLTKSDGTPIEGGKLFAINLIENKFSLNTSIHEEITTDALGKASGLITKMSLGRNERASVNTGPITSLTFNDNSPSPDTITRSDGGSFLTDGFQDYADPVGDHLFINSSTSNNTVQPSPGIFKVNTVTAGTITLHQAGILTNETSSTATLSGGFGNTCHFYSPIHAIRVYKYGQEPFIGPQSFNYVLFGGSREGEGGYKPAISLPADPAITEATQATAITNGAGITVSRQVRLEYNTQIANFTVGLVVTGGTSGAKGTILADTDMGSAGHLILELVSGRFVGSEAITDTSTGSAFAASEDTPEAYKVFNYDTGTGGAPTLGETITVTNAGTDTTGELVERIGDNVSGTLVLENWNGVDPDDNGAITGSASTFAADAHITGSGSFNEEYTWLVDCNAKALTAVYDYCMARLAEATLVVPFDDVIIWGEAEVEKLLFLGADGFFTKRNANLGQGVWLANRGSGVVDFFTSDGAAGGGPGGGFTPPVLITTTLTGMKDNTEVRVFAEGTTDELAGTENATTGAPDNRSFSFDLNSTTAVDIRVINETHVQIDILNFIIPGVNSSLPQAQQFDRNYNDPP